MKLNRIISSWLNGEDYSLRRFSHLSYPYLLSELHKATGKRISSIEAAYNIVYGHSPVVKERSLRVNSKLHELTSYHFPRPLHELKTFVNTHFSSDEILGFYVHGSLSTMDYVQGYSDFDTLVIVRKAVLEDPEWAVDFKRRLARSNTYLYLFDPLQHHGHFIITEYDLRYYFEPIFPLVLFDYSTELTQTSPFLYFRCLNAHSCLYQIFDFWHGYFSNPFSYGFSPHRAYDFKQFVQSILLMPVIYLQTKTKQYYYKKASFDLAKPDFSPEVWSVIENASAVRNACSYASVYPYGFRKQIGLKFHYKYLRALHRFWDRNNVRQMSNIMGPNYVAEALELVKRMKALL